MIKKIIYFTAFTISMGLLEAAIVIYLRALFYPAGFEFPLKSMPSYLITTELAREAATIVMLLVLAWLAGTNSHTRFAWFIYAFAIWDIFYYVFLKLILNWPVSWFTWDVLFLIPCLWIGPVLAPVLLSLLMIVIWALILYFNHSAYLKIDSRDYGLFTLGALIHIVNFCWDNAMYYFNSPNREQLSVLHLTYIPQTYNWFVFGVGSLFIVIAIIRIFNNSRNLTKVLKEGQLF